MGWGAWSALLNENGEALCLGVLRMVWLYM